MSSTSKYDIRLMTKNDYDQVFKLLTNSFCNDEPITRCLGITDTFEFANNVINDCLNQSCSFVAYDTQTNQIVGLCLNEIANKNHTPEVHEYNEGFTFIMQLFDDVHEKLNIFNELNATNLLHIFIINVDKIARGHNLASRLILKSIEYARECLKVDGAFAEATSIYSLRCFKQHEFKIFDELVYAEYSPEHLGELTDKMYDRCYLVGRKF